MQEQIDWKKYLIAFFISATVFIGAITLSNYFNNRKLDSLGTIQENISIDLLSSETQYALLGTLDCSQISPSSMLSDQLNDLSKKIEYSDNAIGKSDELTRLKESYSLLEI